MSLLKHPSGIVGLCLVLIVVVATVLSYVWTPHDPLAVDPRNGWAAPSLTHLFGTDALGRDLFSAVLVGARVTLLAATAATTVAAILGLALAVAVIVLPQWAGALLQRWVDILIAFPTLVLAVILVTSFGASTWIASLAIGLGAAPVVARTIAPELQRAMGSDFALLAIAAGAGTPRLIVRHVLPNAGSTIVVRLTQIMAGAALGEAGLSYLGFGTPAPTPSWGRLLADLQSQIMIRPEVLLVPSLCIIIVVLGFNLLGDGLRDVLDPKTRKARS
jgi:peptide/nickel transport system permease protein